MEREREREDERERNTEGIPVAWHIAPKEAWPPSCVYNVRR